MLNLLHTVFVLWNELDLEIRREDEDKNDRTLIDVVCFLIVDAAAPPDHLHQR